MHHAHTTPSHHASHHIRKNPNKIIVNPVKNFALLAVTRTYAPILNDLVGRTRQRLEVGVILERLGVALASNNKRWRITQNHHTSHHTSSAHPSVLCALCDPSFRTLNHHAYVKHVQHGDVLHPNYSVRRGRLTAQLPCRTGTSYTPVKHTPKYLPHLFVIH